MLYLNTNQFAPTKFAGKLTLTPTTGVFSTKVSGSSDIKSIVSCQAVKLKTGVSPELLVEAVAGADEGPIFGVVLYNSKKSITAKESNREICAAGGVITLIASEAITRGSKVAFVPATWDADNVLTEMPQIAVAGTGDYVLGIALGQAAAAGEVIEVQIDPSTAVL